MKIWSFLIIIAVSFTACGSKPAVQKELTTHAAVAYEKSESPSQEKADSTNQCFYPQIKEGSKIVVYVPRPYGPEFQLYASFLYWKNGKWNFFKKADYKILTEDFFSEGLLAGELQLPAISSIFVVRIDIKDHNGYSYSVPDDRLFARKDEKQIGGYEFKVNTKLYEISFVQ